MPFLGKLQFVACRNDGGSLITDQRSYQEGLRDQPAHTQLDTKQLFSTLNGHGQRAETETEVSLPFLPKSALTKSGDKKKIKVVLWTFGCLVKSPVLGVKLLSGASLCFVSFCHLHLLFTLLSLVDLTRGKTSGKLEVGQRHLSI